MTVKNQQMYDDFQLVFNNLASNLAAGLTPFEISMYLTKAYFELVDTYYRNYEQSEEARKALVDLVKTVKLNNSALISVPNNIDKIVPTSLLYKLPTRTQGNTTVDEVLYIVYEALTYNQLADKCLRGKTAEVIPVSHDDFHQVYENPFKFNNKKALRLDLTVPSVGRVSEIVSKDNNIEYYTLRYVSKPKPIILEQLYGNDSIEGLQTETECEITTSLHSKIVRLAAQMAMQDYKAA